MDKFSILKESQERDYNEYLKLMDASASQKILDIFPQLRRQKGTTILDLGCGSGLLTYHLAKLNPDHKVVGIDICKDLVDQANKKYKLPNLEFQCSSLDKIKFSNVSNIILSSVLHEIYSYSKFDTHKEKLGEVYKFIDLIYSFLVKNGKIIIRDFVRPENNYDIVTFEHLKNDHNVNTEFINFTKLFGNETYLSNIKGKLIEETEISKKYKTNLETFYKYIFRKDYHVNWKNELNERYGFWNETEIIEIKDRTKSVLLFRYLNNPWIIENRIDGKVISKSIPNYQILVTIIKK